VSHLEVHVHGLGVSDVEVPIGLGRESCAHLALRDGVVRGQQLGRVHRRGDLARQQLVALLDAVVVHRSSVGVVHICSTHD
jgi:hypothetical protein